MRGIWFLVTMSIVAALSHSLVPDHWVPYVVVGRAHHWSKRRTLGMAAIGAVAHLASTAAVGLILGIFFQGFLARGGEFIERLTGFLVMAIGLWFFIRGVIRARQGHTHSELCRHGEREAEQKDSLTLGAIFGLRPCVEALPIFLQAATKGFTAAALTVSGWAIASIAGMIAVVYIGWRGLEHVRLGWLEKYAEMLAGVTIVLVGLGVTLIFG